MKQWLLLNLCSRRRSQFADVLKGEQRAAAETSSSHRTYKQQIGRVRDLRTSEAPVWASMPHWRIQIRFIGVTLAYIVTAYCCKTVLLKIKEQTDTGINLLLDIVHDA